MRTNRGTRPIKDSLILYSKAFQRMIVYTNYTNSHTIDRSKWWCIQASLCFSSVSVFPKREKLDLGLT